MSEQDPQAAALANMVEQQLRTWEVLDQRVLDAIAQLPRASFVPESYRALAYADTAIPLGDGQQMMTPRVEARLLQSLRIEPRDSALEIGTGSGYLSALLAQLARHVTTIEIRPSLLEQAESRFQARGTRNIRPVGADGLAGYAAGAPYDLIAVTGSVATVPEALLEQLAVSGRMFVIVGEAPAMEAQLITRVSTREWSTESLFETVVPPLDGAQKPPEFVL